VRIWILFAALAIGVGMWLVINRTRIGMLIRAGVDDREMLAASGLPVQLIFILVFAFGAGLAGIAGIVGGTFQSISPGEDTRFLLASLVVVIVGGMGSITGAALGALVIGLAEQLGLAYAPTYSVVFTFLIMAAVLAFRPQGLLGRG
jgi:branched-chain amino acid transport system permease protein